MASAIPADLREQVERQTGAVIAAEQARGGGGASRQGAEVTLRHPDGNEQRCYLASILRADFTQNGTTGEGMFTADVVSFAMGTGMGYYSVYNLTVLSAEKGSFQDWQPPLNKVLSSLNYTPEFQSFAMSQSNQAASTSQSLSQ